MKSKSEIQQELITRFGDNFNTIDNLITFLNENYHPQIFSSMKEYIQSPCYHAKYDMTIDELTDDYITEDDGYKIIIFDDYRDFKFAIPEDGYEDNYVISYDEKTRVLLKYYGTGGFFGLNKALDYFEAFFV